MKCISFYTLHACSKYINICIYGFISQICLPHLRRKTCREVAALEQLELPNLPEDEVRHVTFPEWPPWCLMFGANISFWMKVYTKLKHMFHQHLVDETHQNKLFSVALCNLWNLRWLWHIHGQLASPCNRPVLVAQGGWFYTYLKYHKCGGRTLTCWVPSRWDIPIRRLVCFKHSTVWNNNDVFF